MPMAPIGIPLEAADSRLGAPSYSEFCGVAPVRRNGQASPFSVAVSRRGAPGGAVAGGVPSNRSGLNAYNFDLKSAILCWGRSKCTDIFSLERL
jgi:hypothetical protein